jgi:hypothetical protein
MYWAVPTSPGKGCSARLRREAQIELRSSAQLGSPRNRDLWTPPNPHPRPSLPFISFLTFSLTALHRALLLSPDRTGGRRPPQRPPPVPAELASLATLTCRLDAPPNIATVCHHDEIWRWLTTGSATSPRVCLTTGSLTTKLLAPRLPGNRAPGGGRRNSWWRPSS